MNRPILVTGAHRSGSTWVGRLIAQSPAVRYIHEPFSVTASRCECGLKIDHWFPYVSGQNEAAFYRHVEHTLASRFHPFTDVKNIRRPGDIKRLIKNYAKVARSSRALIKDPLAIFSAEWLASSFHMDVVVLIRHPAAFISSLKMLNWSHPFVHFTSQPALMRDHLAMFDAEVRAYAKSEHDIIDQGILLWKIIHTVILKYQAKHKDWIFVRHMDLSRRPVEGFRSIYEKLDLQFTQQIARTVEQYSSTRNPADPQNAHAIQRNSQQNIWNWKSRLTEFEVERIRNGVTGFCESFYSDEDWEPTQTDVVRVDMLTARQPTQYTGRAS